MDVVFEEDKGFWSAIQTFMSTTKRPILLTARNHKNLSFVNTVQIEHIRLHTPSYVSNRIFNNSVPVQFSSIVFSMLKRKLLILSSSFYEKTLLSLTLLR